MIEAAQAARTADMNFSRRNVSSVLLLDGKVLIYAASSASSGTPTPTLQAELFDPQAETWTVMALMAVGRNTTPSHCFSPTAVLNIGSQASVRKWMKSTARHSLRAATEDKLGAGDRGLQQRLPRRVTRFVPNRPHCPYPA
jgi:hypothetical protein